MVAVVASGQVALVAADGELKAEAVADTNGNLHVPNAYRTTYDFLGTWAVAADHGQGSQELHVVYASPGTITAYRRDGHFPDGTVLVKEVHFAATGQMTTGTVSHADMLRGWFVMVKDSRGRYPGNNMAGGGGGSTQPTRQPPPVLSPSRGEAWQRRSTTKRIANPVMCRRKRRTGSTLMGTLRLSARRAGRIPLGEQARCTTLLMP
jgi:Cytochrome P460